MARRTRTNDQDCTNIRPAPFQASPSVHFFSTATINASGNNRNNMGVSGPPLAPGGVRQAGIMTVYDLSLLLVLCIPLKIPSTHNLLCLSLSLSIYLSLSFFLSLYLSLSLFLSLSVSTSHSFFSFSHFLSLLYTIFRNLSLSLFRSHKHHHKTCH